MYWSCTRKKEQPLKAVPGMVLVLLAITLAMQIGWQATQPQHVAAAGALPAPPSPRLLRLCSLGDDIALAKILMLWLQAFDNQPGISIPYRKLDYQTVTAWLDTILSLDARGLYPLFAASRLYGEVQEENRQRLVLDFIYRKFLEDSERRWPALVHAVYLARHRLRDLPLALRYARALSDHVTAGHAPDWVRQMQFYVLEDMGEEEAARILLAGLLESGAITDAHEKMFLTQRLRQLETVKDRLTVNE